MAGDAPLERWPLKQAKVKTLYAELAQKLLDEITAVGLGPGDRLGTEHELAQRHGVSRVTVRHALSILERDGYVHRKKALGTFIAKGTASAEPPAQGEGTVVFVCHTQEPTHPYENFGFVTMLQRIEQTLRTRGFSLQVLGLDHDNQTDRKRVHELAHRTDVRGFCFVPIWSVSLEEYQECQAWLPGHTPSIVCNGYDLGVPTCVARAMDTGCRQLVDVLLAHGHRDIALLSSSIFSGQEYAIHASSYVAAFEAAGLPVERGLLHKGYEGESLKSLVKGALTSRIRPTGVFASDARVCEMVFAVARELGLHIPEDLSLVGNGDNVLHIPSPVAVTAYAVQNELLAERAAEMLMDLIDGKPGPAQSVVVPGRLVEGGSVQRIGAAPK